MDEGLVKAASEVQSLVDSNAFVKGFNGLSNEEAKSEFVNGKAKNVHDGIMGSAKFHN